MIPVTLGFSCEANYTGCAMIAGAVACYAGRGALAWPKERANSARIARRPIGKLLWEKSVSQISRSE